MNRRLYLKKVLDDLGVRNQKYFIGWIDKLWQLTDEEFIQEVELLKLDIQQYERGSL